MSLDDFVAISKEVYEKSGYRANLYHYGLYMDMYARANDIQATDKLGGDSAEDYVPYFQTLEDEIKEGWHISPSQAADTASVEEDPMVYGSSPENMTWCTINGSAQLTAYQAATPEGTDIDLTTILFYSIFLVLVKLLNYLSNSTDAYDILLAERGIPASGKVTEAIMPKLSQEEQENAEFINDVITPNSSPMPPFPVEGSSQAQDLLRKLEEKVKYGEYTAQEAAEEYFTEANKMLAGE